MLLDWRSLPSLTALRAFEATARAGSFAGAARALNVTHAAVAQQVRALEQELGVSLAKRQGRQVVLTDAGLRLARTLTGAFTAISDEIVQTRAGASTRGLRVTCSPFMAERVIMPNLKDFWLRHPGAEISLSPTRAYVDLVAEGFDIGIRSRHPSLRDESTGNGLTPFISSASATWRSQHPRSWPNMERGQRTSHGSGMRAWSPSSS